MIAAFVDTSVLVRFLVNDGTDQSERAASLFRDLASGELELHLTATVIFETIYVLNGFYKIDRESVAGQLTRLFRLPQLRLDNLDCVLGALSLWERESPLSFADCYHLVLAGALGLDRIYAFDKKMNRLPGVARVEP